MTTLPSPELRPEDDTQNGMPTSDEMSDTLRRLLLRLASILQAESCAFLLYDEEQKALVAQPPAHGLTNDQLSAFKLSANKGICGSAFVSRKPLIENDTSKINESWIALWNVRNLIIYPLTTGSYGQQTPLGLVLVFNHKNSLFSEDDLRVLSVMSRQLTVVISDASTYLRFSEEKEQLHATLLSLGVALVMVDVNGHISLINDTATRLLGKSATIGAYYKDAINNPQIVNLLQTAIHQGEEKQQEIEMTLPGTSNSIILQTQIALVRSQSVHSPRVIGVVMVFNDITEIRNLERLKTSFVSAVSHELRTPLTSIKGFVATLLQDDENYFDNEMRNEFYEIIDSECDRLKRLIEDLLSVSRIEAGHSLEMLREKFSPLKIAIRVVRAHKAFAKKNQLTLEAPKDLPSIIGDADKFEQILNNLLSNAIKYSPQGDAIKLSLRAENDQLKVTVADHGIGVPADKLERIFQKFERVDNSDTRRTGGTGIGLFLVRHLVEQHGGRVWLESKLGEGSTFHIELPLVGNGDEDDKSTFKDFVK
ncbi:MAG: ATP-binding protein [Abditibacteriaceae bacterium]